MKPFISNCVIYSRVSLDRQQNESAIDSLQEYAKYMKFEILSVFQEKISGTSKTVDRIAFSELAEFVEKNNVQNILLWEISRFSRLGLRATFEIIEYFTEKKVNIYAKKENVNTLNPDKTINHTSSMILGVMSSLAQYERTSILERTKRGLHYHLKNVGAFGLSPYGYDNENKKIVVHPIESLIVKRIYSMFLSGIASPSIAKQLNLDNITTKKGCKWSDVQIREILHNPMHYGERIYSFAMVEVPAIVSKAEYLKAQQIFESHQNLNKDKAIFINYLNGKIKCGCCGLSYFQHARQNKQDFAYKCLSTRLVITGQLTESCGNYGVGINVVNSMVYMALMQDMVSNKSDLKGFKDKFFESINHSQKNIKNEIKIVKADIDKAEKKLNRITQLVINDTLSESEYIKQKEVITTTLDNLTTKYNQLLISESNYTELKKTKSFEMKFANTTLMTMDVELYKYFIGTILNSVIVSKVNSNEFDDVDYSIWFEDVMEKHADRLTKIEVNTLFKTYTFYTVRGFNQYTYEKQIEWDNEDIPINMRSKYILNDSPLVDEICQ